MVDIFNVLLRFPSPRILKGEPACLSADRQDRTGRGTGGGVAKSIPLLARQLLAAAIGQPWDLGGLASPFRNQGEEEQQVLDLSTAGYYRNPTWRLIKDGCFAQLPALLSFFQPKGILLVLGEKSFRSSAYYPKLKEMLTPYRTLEALPVPQNPSQEFIQDEIDRLQAQPFDLVLAIGGGSALDVSKILASIPKQKTTELGFYMNGAFSLEREAVPLVVLPTTAGTGSEVTPYASLETKEKKKITIGNPAFYPTVALIDPELCHSMPAYVTASTGFDALSQAIESFWSIQATPFSRTHALSALEKILGALDKAVCEPKNAEARFDMSFASCEAGLAIAQTKTTAVHSVSYPLTTHFGIAHGHACALTLSSFVRFNAPVMKEAGRPLLSLFHVQSYEEMAKKIEALMSQVGLERSLAKLGVDERGIELVLRDGFRPDRIKNNPRPVGVEDLKDILVKIF